MNPADPEENNSLLIVRLSGPYPSPRSLEETSRLTGIHPDMLLHYCRIGLLGEALSRPGAKPVFDDDALYELRRFDHYHRRQGLDRHTVRLLCGLLQELDRLRAELRGLRH